ncbi:caspase-7-like [Argonauta hians]
MLLMDTTRKYNISQQQFRKIRPNFIESMDNISGFLDEALANKLLTMGHKNHVLSIPNPDNQVRQLHDFLIKKLPRESAKLVSALSASQHQHILSLFETSSLYPMVNKPHGRVVILNNNTFDELETRFGSDRDVKEIEQLFKQFNFDVMVYCDRKTLEMEKIIEEECKADAEHEDCFVLFLMSHGNIGNIYGTDRKVLSYSKIDQLLCGSKQLQEKPKVVYINSCQVDFKNEDPGTYFTAPHLFVHFATVCGKYGNRTEEGSFFIQSLISVYKENQGHCNPHSLATLVNAKVKESIDKRPDAHPQISMCHSTLSKDLIFRFSN